MNTQFADITATGKVIIYMDDILVATEDDLTIHHKLVNQVLERLNKLDLYVTSRPRRLSDLDSTSIRCHMGLLLPGFLSNHSTSLESGRQYFSTYVANGGAEL